MCPPHREQGPIYLLRLLFICNRKGFDRTTIYRNRADLTEVGLLSRTDSETMCGALSGGATGSAAHLKNTLTSCVPIVGKWRVSRASASVSLQLSVPHVP